MASEPPDLRAMVVSDIYKIHRLVKRSIAVDQTGKGLFLLGRHSGWIDDRSDGEDCNEDSSSRRELGLSLYATSW